MRILISVILPIIILGGLNVFQRWERDKLMRQAREVYLEQANLRAQLDSTRLVADQYRKLAEQRELEKDSLAVALDERPILETVVEVRTESVDTVIVAREVNDTLHVNYADSVVEIDVSVTTFPPHNSSLHYLLAPLRLTVSGRCSSANILGQRDALIAVDAGRPVDISSAQFDPELCNPIANIKTSGVSLWDIVGPIGGIALGWYMTR